MTQAQRDKMVAEKNRCPVCRETNGHKLVVLDGLLRDCPNLVESRTVGILD
jgi:hypothetical protein